MSEQSYIVRIYRRNRKHEGLDGIIEMPESGQHAAFHDAHSLWHILTEGKLQRRKKRRVATTKGSAQ